MALFPDGCMKPVLIVKEGVLKPEAIKALNDNNICTVEATDPNAIKFLDPIPAVAGRSKVEEAAILFTRQVLRPGTWNNNDWRKVLTEMYVDMLVQGTPLDPEKPIQQQEREYFDEEKRMELRRIAREEARAERAAAKAAKEAEKKTQAKK